MSPNQTIAFLDGLKEERGRWAAVIAGPTDCESALGDANKAKRLKAFTANAGANTVFSSICSGDLSLALMDALDTFDQACESFPVID